MKKQQIPRWAGLVIAICGIGFMVAGIVRGEQDVILQKAINICLECIGIG